MKRIKAKILCAIYVLGTLLHAVPSYAASGGEVVINEINWMGSASSTTEEWIELYNTTNQQIDLSNWKIIDDDSSEYLISSGVIEAKGYFLISTKPSVEGVSADSVNSLSLANAGDKLALTNNLGNVVDIVNSAGQAWFAGDNTLKLTMAKVDSLADGDDPGNWMDSLQVGGTPRATNIAFEAQASDASLTLEIPSQAPKFGDVFTVSAALRDADKLFSYGVQINYDPTKIAFVGAADGEVLNSNGDEVTFQFGLENSEQGKLILAGSIIDEFFDANQGVSHNGNLFYLTFEVIANADVSTFLTFDEDSFMSNPTEDIMTDFTGVQLQLSAVPGQGTGSSGQADVEVANLSVSLGADRYSFSLNWDAPTVGAQKYNIYRKNQFGNYVAIGETNSREFVDNDLVPQGGNIVPQLEYEYAVTPITVNGEGAAVTVVVTETRGIKSDNNRSDRIDGRDLQKLAKAFASQMSVDQEYKALVDTNYDAIIDGKDLIDLGANWASVYDSI